MSAFNPDVHHRRSIRLTRYDYSREGAYFVTICTHQGQDLFGRIVDQTVHLSPIGLIVQEEWLRSSELRSEIVLDQFVVMPTHFHAVVCIQTSRSVPSDRAHSRAPLRRPRSLGSLVAGFKSAATKRINELRRTPGMPVWQRNYMDRVIRNDQELTRVRSYIRNNPLELKSDPRESVIHAFSTAVVPQEKRRDGPDCG